MDSWDDIVIEVVIIGFLAFLYYVFQKRRIIRNDKAEVLHIANHLIHELREFLLEKTQPSVQTELSNWAQDLKKAVTDEDINTLKEVLNKSISTTLPPHFLEIIQDLNEALPFHLEKI